MEELSTSRSQNLSQALEPRRQSSLVPKCLQQCSLAKDKIFSLASHASQNPYLGEFSEKRFHWAFQMSQLQQPPRNHHAPFGYLSANCRTMGENFSMQQKIRKTSRKNHKYYQELASASLPKSYTQLPMDPYSRLCLLDLMEGEEQQDL